MGRVIDADKLIRRMRIDMDRMKYQYNLDVIEGMSLAIGYIVGAQTAYDVDKVLTRLTCDECETCELIDVCNGNMLDGFMEKIGEIVKGGGRDEE